MRAYTYMTKQEIDKSRFSQDYGLWEKSCGKHPTQKPLSVLTRIIHKAKPAFDHKALAFEFPNGLVEKVKIDKHLII